MAPILALRVEAKVVKNWFSPRSSLLVRVKEMSKYISRRFKSVSTAMVVVTLLMSLSACGAGEGAEDGQNGANEPTQSQQAKMSKFPSFEGKSLYEAIVFARENNLSYTIKDENGDNPKTENTREWKVVKQSPAAGETFKDRNKLELTVEKSN